MGKRHTALVLSAGGMFGAYQAGAYKAIAEVVEPDIVVGASVGALNGWLIASGCSPGRLIEEWFDPATSATLTLFPNAGWRNGWFDPAPLRAQVARIVSGYAPRLPFGLVVVELPWFSTVLVRHPGVTADHLLATCSIPLFLPSVEIDGSRYLDGGVFEKLPVWAAIEMGATRIIAIDSLPDAGPWWLRAGINLAGLFKPSRRYPSDLELTLISPSEPLGGANDAVFWKRENIERWIGLGQGDAARALESSPLYAGSTALASNGLLRPPGQSANGSDGYFHPA
jgi:NTE family protein